MIAETRQLAPDRPLLVTEDQIDSVVYPSLVLTVDALLPDGFEMRPEFQAGIATTGVIGQRFLAARAAAAKRQSSPAAKREPAREVSRPPQEEPPPEDQPERPAVVAFTVADDEPI